MKISKLTISLSLLCILLLVTVASLIIVVKINEKIPPPLPRGITLNGVTSGDAEEMVSNFKENKKCQGKTTAIWLSKVWVDSVVKAVDTIEYGDGVRIYFAKDLKNKRNTAVFVSTYKIGHDNSAESFGDHEDYYEHVNRFFDSPAALIKLDSKTTTGALLFGDICPCSSSEKFVPSPSDNHIDCKQAYLAVHNFMKKGDNHEMNTYSEWFSINFFKGISAVLAYQTKCHPNEPGDGIRVYFAKHTDSTTCEKNHKRKEAFIIIPTKNCILDGQRCHSDFFSGEIKWVDTEKANAADGGGDNGEQCQPNCQGATLPKN